MLYVSLMFSLVMLVSFDRFSTAVIASGSWAAFSVALFANSVI